MRASTRAALKSADMTLAIDVEGFGSLDWRRADELIARGHQAAEKRRAELLKYRVSDADWQAWVGGARKPAPQDHPGPDLARTGRRRSRPTPRSSRARSRVT